MKNLILQAMRDGRGRGWEILNTARVNKDPSVLRVVVWTKKDYIHCMYHVQTRTFTKGERFDTLKEANQSYLKEVL